MRPRLITYTIIFSSYLSLVALSPSADTFTALGWTSAYIDGSTYTKTGNNLPSHWSATVLTSNQTEVSGMKSASIKTDLSGWVKQTTQGTVTVQYKVKTTRTQGAEQSAYLVTNHIGNAGCSCDIWGTYGAAHCFVGIGAFCKAEILETPYSQEKNVGPKSYQRRYFMKGPWVNETDGSKSQTLNVRASEIKAYASVYNGVAIPPQPPRQATLVANASSSGTVKVHPTSLEIKNTTQGMTGTSNTFLYMVDVDIYSENNVPVERFEVTLDNGWAFWAMDEYPTGIYKVFVSAKGALRKKFTVDYANGIGLSGLDLTLKFGDINGDNYVSYNEVSFVQSMIGTVLNSANAFFAPDPFGPFWAGDCDFNQDGQITQADYMLAQPNVGLYGDT
jgi:hypothetical protein